MKNFNPSQVLPGQFDIRIIGDRGVGKTTYLAALAYWPDYNAEESVIQSIEPFDAETGELYRMAQNILEQGAKLEPTCEDDSEDMPIYTFFIDLKPKFSLFNFKKNNLRIQLSCREYGGELFDELPKPITPKLRFYLDDCANASALMILLDGQRRREDSKYAQAFEVLRNKLGIRQTNNNLPTNIQRIAVVLTKGEQEAVWFSRKDILGFLKRKFPKTSSILRDWSIQWNCPIEYFVCSALGIIPGVNRPNVQFITTCAIAHPEFWRPFGLVSPIYWLYTGKHDDRLNDIP